VSHFFFITLRKVLNSKDLRARDGMGRGKILSRKDLGPKIFWNKGLAAGWEPFLGSITDSLLV
jgi:hypothetical protein